MLIYKCGGSVLKDAKGMRVLTGVVKEEKEPLILIVSAFGKTTNALEEIAGMALENHPSLPEKMRRLKDYHEKILSDLIPEQEPLLFAELEALFDHLEQEISSVYREDTDQWFDRIVSYGELFSSVMVSGFLDFSGFSVKVTDIRQVIITDNRFREAQVDFDETARRARRTFAPEKGRLFVTQGYISATLDGTPTTLGREGSDYTAAILGSLLGASKVVLWKDVPGVMSTDPHVCYDAVFLPRISYQEAAEMSFYGAKVIHPKTIKPLQNKHIPLVVRNPYDLQKSGTLIWDFEEMEHHIPVFISKDRQILFSVFTRDFSFILNRHLENLYRQFSDWKFNISLIQISAVSVSFCIDDPGPDLMEKVKVLQRDFEVYFNRDVDLLTFRHYSQKAIENTLEGARILISQHTRLTAQYIIQRVPKD